MSNIARGWREVLAGTLAALAIVLMGPTAGAKTRETLRISIVVYNYANVSPAILAEAEQVVDRIYRDIGVKASWIDVTAEQIQELADDPRLHGAFQTYPIYVGLRSGMAEEGRRADPNVLGTAAHGSHIAWVMYDRAERVARAGRTEIGTVLGHVMAHEIGHLLLPDDAHSRMGIMRAVFDLPLAAQGALGFNSQQESLIRGTLSAAR